MSVSFTVKRADGTRIDLPYAGQRTAADTLAPLAKELGLPLAPRLHRWYRVDAENVRPLSAELKVLLARFKADFPTSVTQAECMIRIIDELDRLANETGWTADFG